MFVRPPLGAEGSRTRLQPGDVLISITADLGIVGVVPGDLGEAYINQHIALVRLGNNDLPRWVGHYFSSRIGQEQFSRLNDQGAKAGLNLPTIARLRVPTPPRHHQIEAVQALDQVDTRVSDYRKQEPSSS
ncbi:MAG: restriction endonuclease subunit S [Kineosporiaceae bacterium]|nr:restriction endonuclease subunit S [Kineosporiaceae bacterium]